MNEETFSAIDLLAPYGIGNRRPVFLFQSVMIEKVDLFGKGREHLKLTLKDEKGSRVSALGFFVTEDDFSATPVKQGARINLTATMEKSYFGRFPELRLRIIDIAGAT